MDGINHLLESLNLDKWKVFGIAAAVILWLLNKLSDRYFARRVRRIQKAAQERSRTDDSNH